MLKQWYTYLLQSFTILGLTALQVVQECKFCRSTPLFPSKMMKCVFKNLNSINFFTEFWQSDKGTLLSLLTIFIVNLNSFVVISFTSPPLFLPISITSSSEAQLMNQNPPVMSSAWPRHEPADVNIRSAVALLTTPPRFTRKRQIDDVIALENFNKESVSQLWDVTLAFDPILTPRPRAEGLDKHSWTHRTS